MAVDPEKILFGLSMHTKFDVFCAQKVEEKFWTSLKIHFLALGRLCNYWAPLKILLM